MYSKRNRPIYNPAIERFNGTLVEYARALLMMLGSGANPRGNEHAHMRIESVHEGELTDI